MSREVLYRSLDASGVPPIVAAPSGGNSQCLTTRGEVDELIADAYERIRQLDTVSQQAREVLLSQLEQTFENLAQQLNLLRDRVVGQLTVGAVFNTLAEARTYLNSLSADIPATSHHRLVLIASEVDPSINGVYKQNGTQVVRADGFTEASSLPSGFKFFVDLNNQQYAVLNDAVPVSSVDHTIASVAIAPWTRVEEILANAPLRKVGPVLELLFNNNYLAVVEGQLTFSSNFLSRIQGIESAQQQANAQITSLQDRHGALEERVNSAHQKSDNNTTAIASVNEQIEGLNSFRTSTQTSLDTIGNNLTLAQGKIEVLQGSQTSQDNELGVHSGKISELETDNAQLKADVQELKIVRPQHNSRITANSDGLTALQGDIASVKSKNTEQDTRLTALEAGAAELATLKNKQQVNTDKLTALDSFVLETRAKNLTQDERLTTLTTQLDDKVSTSNLANLQDQHYYTHVKSFVLKDGVTEEKEDAESGGIYFFTTFEFSTGFGDLNFRVFDLSDALAPFTQRGYSFVSQRVGVDNVRIMFQHNLAAFPDNKAVVSVIRVPAPGN
ncbi:MAG: hypothetical protein F6K58_21835 [Symploca sp. SIO2E9]|nr:hypothetical protein [Symploca sp. SIO2E9]